MFKGRKVYDPVTEKWSTGYWIKDDKGNYYPVWNDPVNSQKTDSKLPMDKGGLNENHF